MEEFKITNFIDETLTTTRHKKMNYSDNIYTFDIEVTSLFEIDGEFKKFDYSKKPEYYSNKNKVALPYIWQFGINDKVFYSRDFYKFNDLLVCLSNKYVRKVIYVHNLSYEFQFLRNIIKRYNYSIIDFITYKKRKIISFVIEELNIEFRCSYCLTNLSLNLASKKYNVKYKKKLGDLDYTLVRSPITPLTTQELNYCEFDILALYEIILYFAKEFKSVAKIPLTQTSIIRKELINSAPWWWKEKVTRMLPDIKMYDIFTKLFTGGFVHSYYAKTNKILNDAYSMDLTSAYPYACLSFGYPMTKFFEVKNPRKFKNYYNNKWCRIMLVKFSCKSKVGHSLISISKLIDYKKIHKDNGRVLSGKDLVMIINEIDLENIKKIYDTSDIKVYRLWCSKKKPLPYFIIDKILTLYGAKTKLKGVEGQEDYYMNSKQKLNSVYGCFCTALIREGLNYSNNEYLESGFNSIEELKERVYNNIFYYPWGAWCTSYCRMLLCNMISKIGSDVVYYDTDSVKFVGEKYLHLFYEDNEIIKQRTKDNLAYYHIEESRFFPEDINGNIHPLGVWELDGKYQKFKTLGAKRYCYQNNDKVHMVVSGLSKSCKINNIEEFELNREFNYMDARKNISNYNDTQKGFKFKDKNGVFYECDNIEFSINMQPTTFKIGLTDDYKRLLEFINYLYNKH